MTYVTDRSHIAAPQQRIRAARCSFKATAVDYRTKSKSSSHCRQAKDAESRRLEESLDDEKEGQEGKQGQTPQGSALREADA